MCWSDACTLLLSRRNLCCGRQGKTVEVGRAYFETPKKRYTILDAPGHKVR